MVLCFAPVKAIIQNDMTGAGGTQVDQSNAANGFLLENAQPGALDGDVTGGLILLDNVNSDLKSIVNDNGVLKINTGTELIPLLTGALNENTSFTLNNGTSLYTNGSVTTINNGSIFNFSNGSITNYNNGSNLLFNNGSVITFNGGTINGSVTINGVVTADEYQARLFNGDVFNGGTFNGTFLGDGSGLTGVVTNNGSVNNITINNGSVENTSFTINNGTSLYTNGSITSINNGSIFNFDNGSITNYNNGSNLFFNNGSVLTFNGGTIEGDVTINGAVTADEYHARLFNGDVFNGGTFNGTFLGDGSGLTGVVTNNGSVNNITINNGSVENTSFTINNGTSLYTNGSITTVNNGSVFNFDNGSITNYNNGSNLFFNNGSVITFNGGTIEGDVTINGAVTADEYHARLFNGDVFNGGTFNGTFLGNGAGLTGVATDGATVNNLFVDNGTYSNGSISDTLIDNGTITNGTISNVALLNNSLNGVLSFGSLGMLEDAVLNGDTVIQNGSLIISLGTPINGYVLTSDINGLASWQIVATAGLTEWTDQGSFLHPADGSGAKSLLIGSDNLLNGGIYLGRNGDAIFNENGNDTSFRVETNGDAFNFFMNGTTSNIGIGLVTASSKLHVNGDVTADSFIGNISSNNLNLGTSSTTNITAGGGVTVSKSIMKVQGNGGPITVTANPQITDGDSDGQFVVLKGSSDTNTLTFIDGNGLSLTDGLSFTVGSKDTLTLIYDSGDDEWIEISRSDK